MKSVKLWNGRLFGLRIKPLGLTVQLEGAETDLRRATSSRRAVWRAVNRGATSAAEAHLRDVEAFEDAARAKLERAQRSAQSEPSEVASELLKRMHVQTVRFREDLHLRAGIMTSSANLLELVQKASAGPVRSLRLACVAAALTAPLSAAAGLFFVDPGVARHFFEALGFFVTWQQARAMTVLVTGCSAMPLAFWYFFRPRRPQWLGQLALALLVSLDLPSIALLYFVWAFRSGGSW